MLILTRKVGESIDIGQDVRLTVKRISRGQVKISFHAPKKIPISRTELKINLDDSSSLQGGA